MRIASLVVVLASSIGLLGCEKKQAAPVLSLPTGTVEVMLQADPAGLKDLSPEDRALAEKQRICPVGEEPLGSMGAPVKLDVLGQPIFICCAGCERSIRRDPGKYIAMVHGEDAAKAALAKAEAAGEGTGEKAVTAPTNEAVNVGGFTIGAPIQDKSESAGEEKPADAPQE